jgi:hypothetical protein
MNEFTLTLTLDELNIVLGALHAGAYKQVKSIIEKIERDVTEQLNKVTSNA